MPSPIQAIYGANVIFSKKPSPENLQSFFQTWNELTPQWIAWQFNEVHFQGTRECYSMEYHTPEIYLPDL